MGYPIKSSTTAMQQLILNQNGRVRSGWRAVIFLLVFTFSALLCGGLAEAALSMSQVDAVPGSSIYLAVNAGISLVLALLFGWFFGWLFENLPIRALGAAFTKGWLAHLAVGSALGSLTVVFAIAIAAVFGGLSFQCSGQGTASVLSSLAISLVVFAIAAAFEEALFRGYILQTFARAHLAWLAILLTSVAFGAVHLGNPNVSPIAAANTVIAGIWFSVAYLKTRDLWLVWGLHLMWNWVLGSIFGTEVSGMTITAAPVLNEIDTGPQWLTGETYGIEGSIACTIALVASTVLIYFLPVAKPDPQLVEMTSDEMPAIKPSGS